MANRAQKSPQTENDLRKIWQHISEQNTTAADTVLDRIERAFDMLTEYPRVGHIRSELRLDLRSFPVESYMIFYDITANGINVVRVHACPTGHIAKGYVCEDHKLA